MLDPITVQKLYIEGNMRPTGVWIPCAGVGCSAMAEHDVVHEPSDGQRVYVPLCESCIDSIPDRQLEYIMEAHGFFGAPDA